MKKKKYFVIILILFLIILIYFVKNIQFEEFRDDIIFFKNFYSTIKRNNKENVLNQELENFIEVSTKKENIKEMSLFSNLSNKANWNEMIYPGTSGKILIKIYGKENLKYKITFKSKNQKPKNLVFEINGKEYDTLENLGNDIYGILQKEQIKELVINWKWEYEENKEQDIQDTIDGISIKKYNFEVVVRGEKI